MKSDLAKPNEGKARCVVQDYFNVWLREDGIVWLERRDVMYPSITAVHRAYDQFLRAVNDWLLERRIKSGELGTRARTPSAWLYDVRGAPARRNDPEFEKVIEVRRPDLLKRSPALAVVVRSAAGKMQVTRLARSAQANFGIFDDFDEAVTWLLGRISELAGSQSGPPRGGSIPPPPGPSMPPKKR